MTSGIDALESHFNTWGPLAFVPVVLALRAGEPVDTWVVYGGVWCYRSTTTPERRLQTA
jgi:hypothetical protein